MSSKIKSLLLKIVLGTVVALLALAVLIPNLLRPQMAADPASPAQAGAWNVRSINTAQVTYVTTYEKIGFAPNLSVLGDVPNGECGPEHACLLSRALACPRGIGQGWCTVGLYRYNIQTSSNAPPYTSSNAPPYKDYWVTATPIQANPKLKNYCSAEDAVMHTESGAPLERPCTREECLALPPTPDAYRP